MRLQIGQEIWYVDSDGTRLVSRPGRVINVGDDVVVIANSMGTVVFIQPLYVFETSEEAYGFAKDRNV